MQKPIKKKKEGDSQCKNLLDVLESMDNFLCEGVYRSKPDEGIVYANNAFIKIFGYSTLEEVKALPGQIFYADDEARLYLMDKIAAQGFIDAQRVLYKRKDGTNFWGLLTSRKVEKQGEVFYEGRLHDISEQLVAENQLKESKMALQKLRLELDRFIYSASHDIRSPISSALGIVNLLKMEGGSSGKYIDMIEASLNRLDEYVRELTAYAKNATQVIEDEPVDFGKSLQHAFDEFSSRHAHFNLVQANYRVEQNEAFYSDSARIQLILYNIIKNCYDYADLNKTSRVLSVEIIVQNNRAFIDVFDNGIGIAPSHLPKVFDMYYRASERSKGSGIGLYTVREAVTKLEGIITINSEYGIGTSIKVEIPNTNKGKLINKKNTLRAVQSKPPAMSTSQSKQIL